MAWNIVSGVVVAVLVSAFGAMMFMVMIIAMNGFSDSDVELAIPFYIVWAGFSAVFSGGMSALAGFFLSKKWNYSMGAAFFASTGTFLIIGGLMVILGIGGAIGMASYSFQERKAKFKMAP